jgi:two-component system, NtrC family, response regulator AtoC
VDFMFGGTAPASAQKVLVVDADPRNVQEIGAALRSGGYQPLEATSFEAAKHLWVTEQPPILIADVRLGQFNGLQLLLRARADRPDVLGVITCAFPDKVLEEETRRFGGLFVVKSVPFESMVATVLGLLSKEPRSQRTVFEERRARARRQTLLSNFSPERRLTERRR